MKRTLALLAILGALAAPGAIAQGQDQGWGAQFSPGQARDARKQGLIVPWSTVEQTLRDAYGEDGTLLSSDLYEKDSGNFIYDIQWKIGDGRIVRVTVDAGTGRIVRGRGD